MSQLYLRILADIMETQPPDPIISPDPFISTQSLVANARMFFRLIRLSLQTRNRIGALINAYYLGYLLEIRASTPNERKQCRKVLTQHYRYASTRIYNIFSILGVQQISRTQRVDFWSYKHLSSPEYNQLLMDALGLI